MVGEKQKMNEIDKLTGLPKELLDATQITREQQKIKIKVVRRRFGKLVTTISGFDSKDEAKSLGKEFKRKLACGGTVKGKEVELQGDHSKSVKEILIKNGYNEGQIDL